MEINTKPDNDLLQITDDTLVLKIKEGDTKAFDELYQRYRARLNSYFYNKLIQVGSDKSLAEDHTQEVFLTLWKKRELYKPDGKFSWYLFTIAKNCWKDYQRKVHRLPQIDSIGDEIEEESLYSMRSVAGNETERVVLSKELSEQIDMAVESLPERQKGVFILDEYEDMSHREISKVMGCRVATVASLKRRANRNLRKILEGYLINEQIPKISTM